MRTVTLDEYRAEIRAQEMPGREHYAFICPACRTVQSAQDLIDAGAGETLEDVEIYLGFACVGRWTDAGSAHSKDRAEDAVGCDWSLGGLLTIHEVEVVTPDGKKHPRFEPASKDAAHALLTSRKVPADG